MGGRPWTTGELRELQVARAGGYSLDDIATGLGRSRSAVRNAVERHGILAPAGGPRKWGQGRLQTAILDALQGGPLTAAEIIARARCKRNSVHVTLCRLAERGVVSKHGHCRWGITNASR